jgi:transposase
VGNIHKRLKNVYGDDTVDCSTVSQWARRLTGESWHTNIRDSPRTGRPHTTQTPDNVQRGNNMVLEDRRVTVKEMSVQLEIGEASVCRILKQLGVTVRNKGEAWAP